MTYTIHGFHLVQANVVTNDSLQGTTLDFLVILDFGNNGNNRKGMVYMLLTRVRDRKTYKLGKPLNANLKYYPSRTMVVKELNRIRTKVANRTYNHLHSSCAYPTDKIITS